MMSEEVNNYRKILLDLDNEIALIEKDHRLTGEEKERAMSRLKYLKDTRTAVKKRMAEIRFKELNEEAKIGSR